MKEKRRKERRPSEPPSRSEFSLDGNPPSEADAADGIEQEE